MDIANKVKKKLANVNADVIVVQPSAKNPNSTGREEVNLPPQIANQLGADFYLSLHINAGVFDFFE
ncbi:MAG: N-acetylmuramoyl-L-alanine amidase [Clostridia bacterium]|nr:N-acetylmuramoyl-L-alanine amidase [Clostridia bacterium]